MQTIVYTVSVVLAEPHCSCTLQRNCSLSVFIILVEIDALGRV